MADALEALFGEPSSLGVLSDDVSDSEILSLDASILSGAGVHVDPVITDTPSIEYGRQDAQPLADSLGDLTLDAAQLADQGPEWAAADPIDYPGAESSADMPMLDPGDPGVDSAIDYGGL